MNIYEIHVYWIMLKSTEDKKVMEKIDNNSFSYVVGLWMFSAFSSTLS
jgi:hypothetical protein